MSGQSSKRWCGLTVIAALVTREIHRYRPLCVSDCFAPAPRRHLNMRSTTIRRFLIQSRLFTAMVNQVAAESQSRCDLSQVCYRRSPIAASNHTLDHVFKSVGQPAVILIIILTVRRVEHHRGVCQTCYSSGQGHTARGTHEEGSGPQSGEGEPGEG